MKTTLILLTLSLASWGAQATNTPPTKTPPAKVPEAMLTAYWQAIAQQKASESEVLKRSVAILQFCTSQDEVMAVDPQSGGPMCGPKAEPAKPEPAKKEPAK